MSSLAERIYRITKRHPTLNSKGKLAEHLGYSRSMVYNYEAGNPFPPREFLDKIAKLEISLGIDDSTNDEGASLREDEAPYHVQRRAQRMIRVTSWAHAGEATNYEELPNSWQDQIPTECRDPKAFAVRLEGPSMEPKFSEGDLLILQPSEEAYSGCLAVCRFKSDGVVFRRVEFLPDAIRLIALNPAYPTDTYPREEFAWIYPVWGRWTQIWK